MIHPDREEFLRRARRGNLIPVYREFLADMETPLSAYLKLAKDSPYGFLLESVEGGEKLGRYSFIGINPCLVFMSKDRHIRIIEDGKEQEHICKGSPFDELHELMARFRFVEEEKLPRFCGGAVGFVSYDMVRFFERLPSTAKDDLQVPDCYFVIVESLVVFDHVDHTVKVVANARINGDPGEAYENAVRRIDMLAAKLEKPEIPPPLEARLKHEKVKAVSNMDRKHFEGMVERAKEYIRAGDVIQVVLSQRFEVPVKSSPFSVYRALRSLNPSPYMFFLKFKDLSLVGASPEIMVRCEDGKIELRPIAGTRPRGATAQEDREQEESLLNDPKELAEHIMLVDLGRNDVGRVSKFDTVQVSELMVVERYSHVMHIASDVVGQIAEGQNHFDVFKASFPAGTVSGAPKIRAMEIIEELEGTRRGPYAGAVTYFGFSGNLDSCITIRTILMKEGKAFIQAGAGIVADSVPAKEFEETLSKAGAMLDALAIAEAFSHDRG